jgi:hypothetical protein
MNISELILKGESIIAEISTIKTMRKGTLNATYTNVKHKDGKVVKRGPYYVLSYKIAGNKTASYRVPVGEAEHIQQEVDNYRRFRSLSDEYAVICDQVSRLIDAQFEDDAKKN